MPRRIISRPKQASRFDIFSEVEETALALRGEGHAVIETFNGQDAINKRTGQKVNLITSDVNRPTMDGIERDADAGSQARNEKNQSMALAPILKAAAMRFAQAGKPKAKKARLPDGSPTLYGKL